jgi:hypothetical protein
MKLTICLFAVLAALRLASAHARQQAPQFNESLAYARLIAAHKLPAVSHAQCYNALTDWLERDKADKQNGPYWFQKVSTEELARMASLSSACATEVGEIRTVASANDAGMLTSMSAQFHWEMLRRAETVLHDHALIEAYLLQP